MFSKYIIIFLISLYLYFYIIKEKDIKKYKYKKILKTKYGDVSHVYHKGGYRSIVLIHGLTGNMDFFIFISEWLKHKGYTVLQIDILSHGNTEIEIKNTIFKNKQIVKYIIDYYSIKEPIFLCHSLGCLISLLYCSEHSYERMIFINPVFCLEKYMSPIINQYTNGYLFGISSILNLKLFGDKQKSIISTANEMIGFNYKEALKYVDTNKIICIYGNKDLIATKIDCGKKYIFENVSHRLVEFPKDDIINIVRHHLSLEATNKGFLDLNKKNIYNVSRMISFQ